MKSHFYTIFEEKGNHLQRRNLTSKHWMKKILEEMNFTFCFSSTETQPTIMKYDWDSKMTVYNHH